MELAAERDVRERFLLMTRVKPPSSIVAVGLEAVVKVQFAGAGVEARFVSGRIVADASSGAWTHAST